MPQSFSVSPSRIARYFYHDCERHLRFFTASATERRQAGIPAFPFEQSPVTAAILEGGYLWEEEVVSNLLRGKAKIATAADDVPLRERSFNAGQTVSTLKLMKPGEFLYQGTLVSPPGFYRKFGLQKEMVYFPACHPDLIQRIDDRDGRPCYRILDIKASDALKTSHKVQAGLYAILLHHVFETHDLTGCVDLNQGGIWLYGMVEPELFDLQPIMPHLYNFLSDDLNRILVAEPEAAAWHLSYRCEWCEFFRHCRKQAEEAESVSMLPYLSSFGRRHLRSFGVDTLEDFRDFLETPDASEVLARCASLSGKEDRLREQVQSLLTGQVKAYGGSSLAMPRGENVRLILTLQREPVSGKIYAAALLRTGNDFVFSEQQRHEEQFVANSPEDCEQTRRRFVLRLHSILSELHRYNICREWGDQKSLQTYVFDSYEAELLQTCLLDSLRDPAVAAEALELLFHFRSEELLASEEHPADETDFPLVVLTGVIRSLFALPLAVAYHLTDVVRVLPPASKAAFDYRAREYLNFRLSNALRSDAIHAAWHHNEQDRIPVLESELRKRLWAAASVVEGIRAAAVDSGGALMLFAWPPKFRLPAAMDFSYVALSRLAFVARYESLMNYLEIRAKRILPRSEREQQGEIFYLTAVNEWQFQAEPYETSAELEAKYGRWLLSDDSALGEQAQMAFPDYPYRDRGYVPKRKAICFATIEEVKVDAGEQHVLLSLALDFGSSSPAIVPERRYLLHRGFLDINTPRVLKRLQEIDQGSFGHSAERLLMDPLGFASRQGPDEQFRQSALRLAARANFTPSQECAFKNLVDNGLTLVWGPPGTGKTHFLALAVLVLSEARRRAGKGLRVLVTAFTHAAIDNCLNKIETLKAKCNDDTPVVKLNKVEIQGCEVNVMPANSAPAFLAENEQCVVGATPYALFKLFGKDTESTPFDLIVIDEGSQLRVPEAVVAISRLAENGRVLVAGDDKQLPPIVKGIYPDSQLQEPLLHRSIYEAFRQFDQGHDLITRQLYENFRMNRSLCRFPADYLYGQRYQSADDEIASQRIRLAQHDQTTADWLKWVLDPGYPWVLCVLEGIQATDENRIEAGLVADVAYQLRQSLCARKSTLPYPNSKVGDQAFWTHGLFIVSPHNAQLRSIRAALGERELREPFFVGTVDKMQGQECEAVIVSYGVSDAEYAMQEGEFIYSLNRLNVALTRARSKCIVFIPRPLLVPMLHVLEQPRAAAGIAYMLELERFIGTISQRRFVCEGGGELVIYRRR